MNGSCHGSRKSRKTANRNNETCYRTQCLVVFLCLLLQTCDYFALTINQKNHGVSYARNTGIRKAVGKYIYFLDSDDYIAYGALEILVAAMEANDLEMLLFNAKVFGDTNVEGSRIKAETGYYKRVHEYPAVCKGEDLFRLLRENREYVAPVSTYLIKKDYVIDNKFLFWENIVHEDELYTFQCLTFASRAGYTGKELYYRRIRENSIMGTRTQSEKMILSVFSCFVCVKQMLLFCSSAEFRKENEDAIFSGIEVVTNSCRDRYGALDETARGEVLNMTGKDKFLFKALILTSFNNNESIKKLKLEIKNKTVRLEKEKKDALTEANIQVESLRNKLLTTTENNRDLEKKNLQLRKKNNNLENSLSFKIGRMVTFFPRKIRDFFKS